MNGNNNVSCGVCVCAHRWNGGDVEMKWFPDVCAPFFFVAVQLQLKGVFSLATMKTKQKNAHLFFDDAVKVGHFHRLPNASWNIWFNKIACAKFMRHNDECTRWMECKRFTSGVETKHNSQIAWTCCKTCAAPKLYDTKYNNGHHIRNHIRRQGMGANAMQQIKFIPPVIICNNGPYICLHTRTR